jgi:5-methyltetrahydrofolate--homocysteine methyltransferase
MQFLEALRSGRVLITDSDIRTQLLNKGLSPSECPEMLNITMPKLVMDIHRQQIKAGASIITCNSSGCNRSRLSIYNCAESQEEIINAAIFNATKVGQGKAYIAYSMGPTGQPDRDFNWYYRQFKDQVKILNKFPVDVVFVESFSHLQETRAALLAVKENCIIPIVCSMTFLETGLSLTGTPPHIALVVLGSLGADAVGINGNTPFEIKKWIGRAAGIIRKPLVLKPKIAENVPPESNPGCPLSPEDFVSECEQLYNSGATIIGGGKGTGALHTRLLADRFKDMPVVRTKPKMDSVIVTSDKRMLEIGAGNPLVIIGERINPAGKPLLTGDLTGGKLDRVVQEATVQAEEGAEMLDINVFASGIVEEDIFPSAVCAISRNVGLPLALDTRNPLALERALRVYPGRALVNSIDLNPSTLDSLLPVIKKYGAAVVALTMGQDAIPASAKDRLDIARNLARYLEDEGLGREDVIFDCLVLPISISKSNCSITLETLTLIKKELCYSTVLGISNISYGLENREELNSVFLSMAASRGLDAAIVNTGQPLVRNTKKALDRLMGFQGTTYSI